MLRNKFATFATLLTLSCLLALEIPSASAQNITPNGYTKVEIDPTQLFWDDFGSGTLDITNNWNAPIASGGGSAASNNPGFTVLGSGTTANGFSYLQTQASFSGRNPGWVAFWNQINVQFGPSNSLINNYLFWGAAAIPGSPTCTSPLTNGAGFEKYSDGKLYAVTYASGVRNVIADLSATSGTKTQPIDGNVHQYITYLRGDKIIWTIDGDSAASIVAQTYTGALGPDMNSMQMGYLAIACATPPVTPAVLQVNQATVADTSRGNFQISDPKYPWRRVTVGKEGSLYSNIEGQKSTYSIALQGLVVAAAGTDFFEIKASSKIVKITRCQISGVATASATVDVVALTRSTANTTGTSTSPTPVPHDPSDIAATATVKAYTVNPGALGTLIGNIRAQKLTLAVATTPAISALPSPVFDFGTRGGAKEPTLRASGATFALNYAGGTAAGNSINLDCEWTEE